LSISLFFFPARIAADLDRAASRLGRERVGVWGTGEELTNSFSEAQILTAGVTAGRILTDEIGHGWRRGRFEYAFDIIFVFRQFRPQPVYGGGFEPVILRWNSRLHAGQVAPYIELAWGRAAN
jgi:hypothetical protein